MLLMNANKATQDNSFFKKILIDNLKFILVLEFVVNLYTFNLLIELILVPFLFVIIAISAYAEIKKEYLPVKKMVDYIMFIFGLFLITYALVKILGDYQSFTTSENMRAFILPPLLTIAYIPFLYLFVLMMVYENLFLRIDIFMKDNKALTKFAKRKIIRLCHLDLRKLNRFSRDSSQELIKISNKEDVRKLGWKLLEKYKDVFKITVFQNVLVTINSHWDWYIRNLGNFVRFARTCFQSPLLNKTGKSDLNRIGFFSICQQLAILEKSCGISFGI